MLLNLVLVSFFVSIFPVFRWFLQRRGFDGHRMGFRGVFSFGYIFFFAFYLVLNYHEIWGSEGDLVFLLDFGFIVMGVGYERNDMLGLFACWELLSPQIQSMAIANIHFTVTAS